MTKVLGLNVPLNFKDPLVLIGTLAVGGWLLLADNSPLNTFLFGDVSYAAAEDPQPQAIPMTPPPPERRQRPPRPDMPPPGGHPGGPGPGGGQGHPGGPPAGHPGPWPRPGPPGHRPPDWRIPRPDPRRPRFPSPPRFRWPTFNFRVPRYPWLGLPENNISYEQCVWAGEQVGKDITNCCQDAFEMGRNILINEVENCLYCNQRDC